MSTPDLLDIESNLPIDTNLKTFHNNHYTLSVESKNLRIKKITILFCSLFALCLYVMTPSGASAAAPAPCFGAQAPLPPSAAWTETSKNTGEIIIHWGGSDLADKYAIVYGTKSGTYQYGSTNIGNSNSRSFTVRFLSPGTQYYFRIYAIRSCSKNSGIGDPSIEVSSIAPTGIDNEAPALTGKLTGVPGPKTGEVTLSWKQVPGASNYHVVYGKKFDKYTYGALNLGNVSAFTVGLLTPGETYYFSIIPDDNKFRFAPIKITVSR